MIYINYEEVHRLAQVAELIEPIRRAFVMPEQGPVRTHYEMEPETRAKTLLIMPAWQPGQAIGIKVSTIFSENHHHGRPSINGMYVLLSWQTGEPKAVIDGSALTLLRTAAVSALAADLLARQDAAEFLMVGSGALSRFLIEGHAAVRPYRILRIWGRDRRKAGAVADAVSKSGVPVTVVEDLESAVRSADVVSCATMAENGLIKGAWLKPQSHLDLVGSFKPSMRESDDDCIQDADITVDIYRALDESGDLIGPLARGILTPGQVQLLRDRLERKLAPLHKRRTVFKSVGVAVADLAVAETLYKRRMTTLDYSRTRVRLENPS